MKLTQEGSIRSLSEARVVRAAGELETAILAEVEKLAPGKISPDIDLTVVSKGYLTGKVANLRKRGKLTLDIGVVKTKTGGYAFARYHEPRISKFAKWAPKAPSQPVTRRKQPVAA